MRYFLTVDEPRYIFASPHTVSFALSSYVVHAKASLQRTGEANLSGTVLSENASENM